MTQDLLALADWLSHKGVTHVALEFTGEFWKPVYNILEGAFIDHGGQCPAYQERARTQDGRAGCRLDR